MENETVFDILQIILDDPSIFENNPDNLTLRNFISVESIKAIENNIDFFNEVPNDEIKSTLENFLEILFYYERDIGDYETNTERLFKKIPEKYLTNDKSALNFLSKIEQKQSIKPSIQIQKDINLIKKYQSMLERLFPLQACQPPRVYVGEVDESISTIYDINMDLLKDLEQRNFKKINKQQYYSIDRPSKKEIQLFLDMIHKKYNLKNVSLIKKQLKDELCTATT